MNNFDVKGFITTARQQGYSDSVIRSHLEQRGVTPAQPTQQTQQTGGFQTPQWQTGVEPEIQEQKTTFLDRARETFERRGDIAKEAMDAPGGIIRKGGRLAGQVAATGFDIVGLGLGQAVRGGGKALDVATAPFRGAAKIAGVDVPKPTEAMKSAGLSVLKSPVGQKGLEALEGGMEKYQAWKDENPGAAADLEAVVNVASIIPMGAGARGTAGLAQRTAAPVIKTGEKAIKSGAKATQQTTKAMVTDLIAPTLTASKLPKGKRYTDIVEGGIVTPRRIGMTTKKEKQMVNVVSKIPNIDKGNILTKVKTMEGYIGKEARNLEKLAGKHDVIFPRRELVSQLNRTVDDVIKNVPVLTGDAGKAARRVANEYIRRINSAEGKLSNVLKLRKDMDAWIKTFKGERAFEGQTKNAMKVAMDHLRNSANQYFIKKSPVGSAVEQSLRRQHLTFEAVKNAGPKALKEAGSKLERGLDVIKSAVGTRSKLLAALAIPAGIGTLHAMSIFSPVVAAIMGGGAGVTGVYRLLINPATRKRVGQTLKGIGDIAHKIPVADRPAYYDLLETLIGIGAISAKDLPDLVRKELPETALLPNEEDETDREQQPQEGM